MHLALAIAVAAVLAGSFMPQASAQTSQVCAIYRDGSMLCYYDNLQQCYEAISGLGRASCVLNPAYDPRFQRR